MMKLGKLKIDERALASQGNAILGIRDSGKTYTATVLAEEFHEAGIPFVAFDPIGVWRFLRVPGKGRGYPVVVAGGTDGDLPLTVSGAPEIVRSAMANGISLVIDLFDINLSKADWKRIVTSCVRVLLHENSKHGLRHVFIEEAAEFAPQRVGPDQGQVYAEMEKLARMGGNSRLGYTLINQRAEEVNKALLELCDNLFLHRQKGRNSLTALSKWLDIGNVAEAREIVGSLPTMPTGECWAWLQGSETPERVKVPAKNSLHPDRRVMRGDDAAITKKAVDVGSFVKAMHGTLGKIEQEARTVDELKAEVARLKRDAKKPAPVDDAAMQVAIKRALVEQKREADRMIEALRKRLQQIAKLVTIEDIAGPELRVEVREIAKPDPARLASAVRAREHAPPRPATTDGVSAPQQRILDVLAQLAAFGIEAPNKLMVAAHAGASPRSSGYANNCGALRTAGLIEYPSGGLISLTDAGRAAANPPARAPTIDELQDSFLRVLSAPQAAILRALIDAYPKAVERDELAASIGVSAASSGYANNLGSLRTLGALDYPARGKVRAADFLFEGA